MPEDVKPATASATEGTPSAPPAAANPPSEAAPVTPPVEPKTGEAKPTEGAPATPAAKAEGEAAKAEPETYELAHAENSHLPAEAFQGIAAYAKESGLSKDQAHGVLAFAERQAEAYKAQNDAWIRELMADKEFGGDRFKESSEMGFRAIREYGGPDVEKFLIESRVGNNPHLFRTFARIGRLMAEAKLVQPDAVPSASERDADIFYGTSK